MEYRKEMFGRNEAYAKVREHYYKAFVQLDMMLMYAEEGCSEDYGVIAEEVEKFQQGLNELTIWPKDYSETTADLARKI